MATEQAKQQYKSLVQQHSPPRPIVRNLLASFVVGGLISVLGQFIWIWITRLGFGAKDAYAYTGAVLIGLSALATGFGVYDALAKFGGMGANLPITGFANSIVSPAIEFKREGYVMGVAAKMFTIAGPVIVYGLAASALVALVRWLVIGVGR